MAVSRALRRLLHIRGIEEEQSRLALESALGELQRLKRELAATAERGRRGRRLVGLSASSGELTDRLAGLEEEQAADRQAAALAPRISDAELHSAALRRDFLARKVERRQAETLIHEAEAQEALKAGRRGQQALDDWYGNRVRCEEAGASQDGNAAVATAPPGDTRKGSVAGNRRLEQESELMATGFLNRDRHSQP